MMVPLFSDAQIKRLKNAHADGISTPELSSRFGVSEPTILDIIRGKVPKIKVHENPIEDGGIDHNQSIESCRLHLLDLIEVYRPEVFEQYKTNLKAIRQDNSDEKRIMVAVPKEITERTIENLIAFKRSTRIFNAGLLYFDVTQGEMIGDIRIQPLPLCRQKLMYAIYAECSTFESTISIGKMFHKDHSTVVHALRKIRKLIDAGDEKVIADVIALRKVK